MRIYGQTLALLGGLAMTACGGGYRHSTQAAFDTARQSGGDTNFGLFDQQRQHRQAIEDHLAKGALAVRLDGDMIVEVIPDCFSGSRYRFRGSTPYTDTANASWQRTIGGGGAAGGGALTAEQRAADMAHVRLRLVGAYMTPSVDPKTRVSNDRCDRATHVLTKVEVGAVEIRQGASAGEGGALAVAGVGVQAAVGSANGSERTEGIMAACDGMRRSHTAPPEACAVPLRAKVERLPRKAYATTLVGAYDCGGSSWDARVEVEVDGTGEVTGRATVVSGDTTGRWGLRGRLDDANRVELKPVEPIEIPALAEAPSYAGVLNASDFVGEADGCIFGGRMRLTRAVSKNSTPKSGPTPPAPVPVPVRPPPVVRVTRIQSPPAGDAPKGAGRPETPMPDKREAVRSFMAFACQGTVRQIKQAIALCDRGDRGDSWALKGFHFGRFLPGTGQQALVVVEDFGMSHAEGFGFGALVTQTGGSWRALGRVKGLAASSEWLGSLRTPAGFDVALMKTDDMSGGWYSQWVTAVRFQPDGPSFKVATQNLESGCENALFGDDMHTQSKLIAGAKIRDMNLDGLADVMLPVQIKSYARRDAAGNDLPGTAWEHTTVTAYLLRPDGTLAPNPKTPVVDADCGRIPKPQGAK